MGAIEAVLFLPSYVSRAAADLRNKSKKSPTGTPYVCPWAVVSKIRNKVISGTEMPRNKSQAYGL